MANLPHPLLSGVQRDYSIEKLFAVTKEDLNLPGERQLLSLVLPPWQRKEVWTEDQKRRFIEGIFLGLGTGYYVINGMDYDDDGKSRPMSGWLLDGQQRITAIRDFTMDLLPIFDGIRFSDLDEITRRRRFNRVTFPCFELEYCNDETTLQELYDRLNFGGTPHLESERASRPILKP